MEGVPRNWASQRVYTQWQPKCLTRVLILLIANLSDDAIEAMCTDFTSGIYYGWVQIGDKNSEVYPMVMSLGWNPYYQNEKRSAVWMKSMDAFS